MKRPRKYGPGEPFHTIPDFIRFIRASYLEPGGMLWVGKGKYARAEHVAWTSNQSFYRIVSLIETGWISQAVITNEYREWLEHETEAAEQ